MRNAIDELMEIDRPLSRLFADLELAWPYRRWAAVTGRPFLPTTDMFERGDDLVFRAELPGIDPAKDVTVTAAEGVLTIKGERRQDSEVKDDGYIRRESSYGAFERHLPIPKGVTESQIKATYGDGVLEVVIPGGTKSAPAPKAKAIPVKPRA